jgi:YfiH family protein
MKENGGESLDFVRQNKNGVDFYTFGHLDRTNKLRSCFTSRQGGVSEGFYGSLNLGFNTGDSRENVLENFRILCGALGFEIENTVFSKQVHRDHVAVVSEKQKGCGIFAPVAFDDADALVTDKKGIVLVAFFADCVPVLLLDPVREVLGLSHAGWRGTVLHIARKCAKKMTQHYACDAKDILAGIGPSIHPCCFEIGPEVYEALESAYPGSGAVFQKNGKLYGDLQEANRTDLMLAGLLPDNIKSSGICTSCRSDLFYSHRASGGKRGSLAVLAELI